MANSDNFLFINRDGLKRLLIACKMTKCPNGYPLLHPTHLPSQELQQRQHNPRINCPHCEISSVHCVRAHNRSCIIGNSDVFMLENPRSIMDCSVDQAGHAFKDAERGKLFVNWAPSHRNVLQLTDSPYKLFIIKKRYPF